MSICRLSLFKIPHKENFSGICIKTNKKNKHNLVCLSVRKGWVRLPGFLAILSSGTVPQLSTDARRKLILASLLFVFHSRQYAVLEMVKCAGEARSWTAVCRRHLKEKAPHWSQTLSAGSALRFKSSSAPPLAAPSPSRPPPYPPPPPHFPQARVSTTSTGVAHLGSIARQAHISPVSRFVEPPPAGELQVSSTQISSARDGLRPVSLPGSIFS